MLNNVNLILERLFFTIKLIKTSFFNYLFRNNTLFSIYIVIELLMIKKLGGFISLQAKIFPSLLEGVIYNNKGNPNKLKLKGV